MLRCIAAHRLPLQAMQAPKALYPSPPHVDALVVPEERRLGSWSGPWLGLWLGSVFGYVRPWFVSSSGLLDSALSATYAR